jgi:hypothetical protein
MEETKERFGHWAVLELLGHVRLGGYITEEPLFGVNMGRIDIPGAGKTMTTQYFGGSSVYRLTPCTEEVARAVAAQCQPTPIHRWELPKLDAPRSVADFVCSCDCPCEETVSGPDVVCDDCEAGEHNDD